MNPTIIDRRIAKRLRYYTEPCSHVYLGKLRSCNEMRNKMALRYGRVRLVVSIWSQSNIRPLIFWTSSVTKLPTEPSPTSHVANPAQKWMGEGYLNKAVIIPRLFITEWLKCADEWWRHTSLPGLKDWPLPHHSELGFFLKFQNRRAVFSKVLLSHWRMAWLDCRLQSLKNHLFLASSPRGLRTQYACLQRSPAGASVDGVRYVRMLPFLLAVLWASRVASSSRRQSVQLSSEEFQWMNLAQHRSLFCVLLRGYYTWSKGIMS